MTQRVARHVPVSVGAGAAVRRRQSKRSLWVPALYVLLAGYLCLSRSFAYLGVPAAGVFIGEVFLGGFILAHGRASLGRWFTAMLRPSSLGAFSWALYAFLLYGVVEVIRGIGAGYDTITVLQGFPFNYYPLYLFVGLWVGSRYPDSLARAIRFLAWANGLYGMAYIAFLSRVTATMPGAPDVPLFGQPAGSAVAIIGLLTVPGARRKATPLLLLNAAVLLGVQVRAEWLGLLIALVVWALITRKFQRVAAGFAVIAVLLAVGAAFDVRIPSPESRGGEISARALLSRAIAPINPDLAQRYSNEALSHAGTVSWRTEWWGEIWRSVHERPLTTVLGHGYGFPLRALVEVEEAGIRTPHNAFFYALGYGGWLGVALFTGLMWALAALLWRTFKQTRVAFGFTFFVLSIGSSLFSNFFETPFGAIPFYILCGLAAGGCFAGPSASSDREIAARPSLTPAARYPSP